LLDLKLLLLIIKLSGNLPLLRYRSKIQPIVPGGASSLWSMAGGGCFFMSLRLLVSVIRFRVS
jgi:hypothetical protein